MYKTQNVLRTLLSCLVTLQAHPESVLKGLKYFDTTGWSTEDNKFLRRLNYKVLLANFRE